MIHFTNDEIKYLENVVLFTRKEGTAPAVITKDDFVNLVSNNLWKEFIEDVNDGIRGVFARLLSANPRDSVETAACQERLRTLLDVREWIVKRAVYENSEQKGRKQ